MTYPCMDKRGCPQAALRPGVDKDYCPCWQSHGLEETNTATQETRVVKGCFFHVIPRLMEHVIKASNRPAAELSATRSEAVNGAVQELQKSTQLDVMTIAGALLQEIENRGLVLLPKPETE